MSRVGWYARRMRAMGPAEVLGRSGRAGAAVLREATGRTDPPGPLVGGGEPDPAALLAAFRARPGLLDAGHAARAAAPHAGDASAVIAAADRACAHRFRYFGLDEAYAGDPVDWARDPLSGYRWPDLPSRRIDHRTTGDPKWIWELNRLQHLPLLAQAWLLTGDDRYAGEALDQLDGWIAANPPGRGIAWRGAFEAGVRALSVVTALQALRHSPLLTAERYAAAVAMLDAGARRCWRDRSLHSSANNHLVGELAGLAVVALAVPELDAARAWERRALDRLAREADRQILADGSGAEQAIGYQVFTSDLLAVVLAALRLRDARDGRAAATIARALDRGASYLCTLLGDDDPVPHYGDDDEGVALRLDAAPVRTPRAHLATVAALTGHAGAARCGRPDLASAWFARASRPSPGSVTCAEPAGLAVLRDGGRRLTVDIGPLGYLSLAAHGHADALAVTLAAGGRELVGDPGTGSYYRNPAWRDALRGTRSHATLSVDDVDQSEAGGPFLWTRHAVTTVHERDRAAGVVDAEHDGYRRLEDPVTHRRRVVATPGCPTVAVLDLVACAAVHRIRTAWPLPPDLDATPVRAGFRVTRDGACILTVTHAATVPWSADAVRGDERTGLGWWSGRLEQREPSWLVGGTGRTRGAVTAVVTLLHVPAPGAGEPDVPVVTVGGGRVRATWRENGAARRIDVAVEG